MPDARDLSALARRLDVYAARYEGQHDSRCVFTLAYALMTRRLEATFGDPSDLDWGWIAQLAVRFGQRYTEALDAFDGPGHPPPAWAHVFGTIVSGRTSVLEDLIFAMTAHIVRDLPHALSEVGLQRDGVSRLREFHHVNDVMAGAIGDVQDVVARRYGPYTRWLDRFGRGYDEILTNYGIRVSRAVAWYNASRLLDRGSAAEAALAIERSPRIFIETVMHPPVWSVRLLFRALRLVSSLVRRWPRPDRP